MFSGQGALRVRVAQQFQEAKAAYLLSHGEEKKVLRVKVDALRADLKTWLHSEAPTGAFDWAIEFAEIFAPRPALSALDGGLNLGDTLAATEAGGFDIIVANPPFVRQELLKAQKPVLKARYECFDGTADLFVYFYERAVKILRKGGTLSFTSSNKYYRTGYGKKLRTFLARQTSMRALVDFDDAPVFGAIAYASILIAVRTPPAPDATAQVLTWAKGNSEFERLGEIFASLGQPLAQQALGSDGWRLASPAVLGLLAKLRANGTPLGEYVKGRWYWGIKTGLNEAFVVDRATKDRLIAEDADSARVLHPFLRGRDVKRWRVDFADQYLVKIESSANVTHPWLNRTPAEAEKVFAQTLPGIFGHLSRFRSDLIARTDQGMYFWELRSCAYWHEFARPKLIVPAISGTANVSVDVTGFLSNNKTSIFVCEDSAFVAAMVNSAVAIWFVRQVFATKQGGFFDFEPRYSSQWPIPAATLAEKAVLTALVDRITAAKDIGETAIVRALEAEIDTHVFRLYRLTQEEQALITTAP